MEQQQLLVLQPDEFWKKHIELTREVVKDELSKLPSQQQQEDLIIIDEVQKILHKKSKQCIYNYLDDGKLIGYTLGGNKVNNPKEFTKKEKEGLYFLRSDIYGGLKKRERSQSHE
jgi:hypothetical protein